MQQNPARLVALDGWRAISALIVVAAHIQQHSSLGDAMSFIPKIDGLSGVEFFFGISGFVICRGLLAEKERLGQISLLGFYIRRFCRIIPPLAMYIIAVVLLADFGVVEHVAVGAVKGLTFTCNLEELSCGRYLGAHFWSLSVEEQFYLVIPLLLALTVGRHNKMLTIALLAFPLLVMTLFAAHLVNAGLLLSRFTTIAFGVLVALHENRIRQVLLRLPPYTFYIAVLGIILLIYVPADRVINVLRLTLKPMLILFMLLYPTYREMAFSRILCSPPLQLLGAASYSFYLWQQLATYPFPGASGWFYVVSIGACALVALASHRWIETPFIRLGSRLSRRNQVRPISVSAATTP